MILFNGPILLSDPIVVEFSQCSFLIYIAYSLGKTASVSWLWSSFYQMSLFKSCGFGICFFVVVHFTYNKKGTSDITIQKYLCNLFQKWDRKVLRIFVKKNNLSRKSNPLLYSKSPICISIIHLHYLNIKHCNRFINCVPFNFSIIRKRCRDRRQ